MRQYLYEYVKIYNYVFCVNKLSDRRLFISNRGAGFIFPLHLYSKGNSKERRTNVTKKTIETLKKSLKKEVRAEEVFLYVYAVLHSTIYRKKYAESLKIAFPRIPFTSDYDLFISIGNLGKKLVDLHLMKSENLKNPIAKFQGDGDNTLEEPIYNQEKGRVYINKTQFFEGVEKSVWEYQIGGYQVLSKWLRYRRGRKLSLEDIKHYCKVVTALKKTIEIQEEIDKLYPDVEKDIVEFKENDKQNASLDEF